MNINELISSGKLELYVLGALPQEEAQEIAAFAVSSPELQKELEAIERALLSFADTETPNPRPQVRTAVMEALGNDRREATGLGTITTAERHFSAGGGFGTLYRMAASIAILALLASSFYFWNQWQQTEEQLANELNQNRLMADEQAATKTALQEASGNLALLQDTATVRVAMKGVGVSPNALALVYWNKRTNDVYLDIEKLPLPPTDKQYQLWAIADGAPVDAGVFDVTDTVGTLQQMKTVTNAQAFAVTLEKRGGSPTPTLEAMYVIGTL